MWKQLKNKIDESLASVLPISVIVLLLSVSIAPVNPGILVLFLFGMILLIAGMGLFSLGSGMSMHPLGESIGRQMRRSKRAILPLAISFALGTIITIAEPDLQVLANQVPSLPNAVLIWCVAVGVGLFLVLSMLRSRFHWKLSRLLLIFYAAVLLLACFAPAEFLPAAFDSGGVTTGPITVPFVMALGAGLASARSDDKGGEESFGLVALCSIGPILSVLLLSICFAPSAEAEETVLPEIVTTRDAFLAFRSALPRYGKEVLVAFLPIVGVFLIFQLLFRRFHRHQMLRITMGMLYTYIGLVLFLTGANVGFMPAGQRIGAVIAESSRSWLLIPVGMVIGYFVVAAEPAVHVLKKQVEEVSGGAISQKAIALGLSLGVAVSLGISMLRILTGISVFPFLIVGYIAALIISYFVPPIYTGVAFDSGGVASGPMTSTFILPFATGACTALGGNLMTDAFGVVAMVAMTPPIAIQVVGLASRVRRRWADKKLLEEMAQMEDTILYFDAEEDAG